jgi:hypothetical protein
VLSAGFFKSLGLENTDAEGQALARLILRSSTQQQADESALAIAAAGLSAGQSVSFSPQSSFEVNDLEWQTAFYHDDVNGRVHLMGKPQNSDSAWSHQYYDIATDTWGNVTNGMWNNTGHIYGNTAIDYATGDLFQSRNCINAVDNPRRVRWWKHSLQDWSSLAPVSRDIYDGSMNDTPNGLAFHPNLYGVSVKGLVWGDQISVHCHRFSNDSVQRIQVGTDEYGAKEGGAVYWPAQDCVLIGGSAPNGHLARIDPNGGGTPTLTDLGQPPIRVQGASSLSGSGFGSLHVHPGNPNKVLIVETIGQRVYESSDGSSWTRVDDHPYTRVPRVACSLRASLGCLWAIGRDVSGNFGRLYRPAA